MKLKYNILLLTSVLVLAACGNASKDEAQDNHREVSDSVEKVLKTVLVTEAPMTDELELNGDVMCDESRMSKVFVPCSGKLSDITVEVGDRIAKGGFLAKVHSADAADYGKQLSEAEAELSVAERELRMKQDMQKSGMASDREVTEALAKVSVIRAEKSRLRSVASINGYANHSDAVLRSPIAGYVIAKRVYNGSFVDDSSNDEAAFEIADLSDVWVVADVYESDIEKVRMGASAYVTTMAYPGQTFSGKIDKIYNVLDNESKTMKVRVKLHNVGTMLKPGMFASLHIVLGESGQRMPSVPSESVTKVSHLPFYRLSRIIKHCNILIDNLLTFRK